MRTINDLSPCEKQLRRNMLEAKRLGLVKKQVPADLKPYIKHAIRSGKVSKKALCALFGLTYQQLKADLSA